MQKSGAFKELQTGAQKRVSFKEQPDQNNHSQSRSTQGGSELSTADTTFNSGHRQHAPLYENSGYHMQRRPRAESSPNPPQSTDHARLRTVSPSSSLPVNFQQRTASNASQQESKVRPSSVHEYQHSQVGASSSCPKQVHQSHTNATHKSNQQVSPSKPQPIITSKQSPSKTTAHRMPSPSQSLPARLNLADIPDIDAHLYVNLLDDDDLQSDSDLAPQDHSQEHSGDPAGFPQHSYINLPNFNHSGEPTAISQNPGNSVSNQETFSGPKDGSSKSKEDVYVNLPYPDSDVLYINLTSDLGVEILNMFHSQTNTL